MLSKILLKEFNNGLKAPVYYLWSNESCFLEEAQSKFVETIIASHPMDFNYEVFDPTAAVPQILDAISTLPFMAPRRLVVIKDFHKLSASALKILTPYFKSPLESTCLLLLSEKAPKASLKGDLKAYSLSLKEWDIPAWLKQAASERGVMLTRDAVEHLIEFVGYDIGLLLMEVEKLKLSGSKTITGKDIISSISMMRKYTPFDLIDSLIAGQKTRAFRVLKTILSANAMEATVILGTLNWHYKQFYSLWQNRGQRPLKMRERTYRALSKHLASYSEVSFYYIFRSLHEADLGIKSSGRPELEIEMLLVKLLQKEPVN